MLKVTNIRLGFANNSSSSHSILLANVKHKYEDDYEGYFLSNNEPYFGWEGFICASPEAKAKYFACQLASTLSREVGKDVAGLVVSSLFGVERGFGSGTIDHQSVLCLPRYRDGTIAIGFVEELFKSCINDPRVVIGGGNDNGDDTCPIKGEQHSWISQLPRDNRDAMLIAREEPYGWCLFNKVTGARIRLQRDDAKVALPSAPELVDLGITAKCNKNCAWCYRGSTYKGEHADIKWLKHIPYSLSKLEVFEVVIGGGEPTLHPDFLKLLENFHYCNIVPNFTTASSDWLHKPEFVEKVVKYAGSIAFSCNSLDDVGYFGRLILLAGEKLASKAVIQSIVGIVDPKELTKMVAMAESLRFKYSLVGFKATGRAPKKAPFAPSCYNLKKLTKDSYVRFYADTALLHQFPDLVEKYTCDVVEGRHSMYIDGLAKTMSSSSYTDDLVECERKDYLMDEEVIKAFHGFQKAAKDK